MWMYCLALFRVAVTIPFREEHDQAVAEPFGK